MWVYLNYNDFASGINSLFGIMALNDWQFMVLMYDACLDGENFALVFFFFVSFIMTAYFTVLNILVAFIIDAYS
jgi:hypothetical protein